MTRVSIFRKIILLMLIVAISIVLGVVSSAASIPASSINIESSNNVMSGDSSTVTALATQDTIISFQNLGRLVTITLIVILSVALITDIYIDIRKNNMED